MKLTRINAICSEQIWNCFDDWSPGFFDAGAHTHIGETVVLLSATITLILPGGPRAQRLLRDREQDDQPLDFLNINE
jgi:hypothetical protein